MDGNKPEKSSKGSGVDEIVPMSKERGYIRLPFDERQFKEFIKGLLGRPQTINRTIAGAFEVKLEDLINLHYLIEQRVSQQNEGTLINFTAKVSFSDGSSVLLNSLDELGTYNETRPIVSKEVHLTWDYLVRFQDKDVPEKQQIQVSIYSSGRSNPVLDEEPITDLLRILLFSERSKNQSGFFSFEIRHTARTWGTDIDTLMTNYIQSLLTPESKIRRTVRRHSFVISVLVGMIFLVAVGNSFRNYGIELKDREIQEVLDFLDSNTVSDIATSDIATLNKKIDYITEYMAVKHRQTDLNGIEIFGILGLMSGTFLLFFWTQSATTITRPGFILLTKEAYKRRDLELKRLNRKWLSFIGAVIVSVTCSVIANYLWEEIL